jgi:putative endopeptidase
VKALFLCAAALSALSIAAVSHASGQDAAQSASQPAHYGKWGFDLAGEDTATKPGDDFFRYANGKWDDSTPIPGDHTRYGVDYVLSDTAEARVRAILENGPKGVTGPALVEATKIGAFYQAFMDEKRIEALGAKPIAPELAAIRSAASREALAVEAASPGNFMRSVFGVGIQSDLKAPDHYAVYVGQGGLSLPDRDYYLTPQFAAKKAAYQVYVAKMLTLAGWDNADANAQAIVAFETRIAEVSLSRAEQRDPNKLYNPMSLAELEAAAPGFPWRTYLAKDELGGVDRLIVAQKTAIPKIAAIYAETPLETLKAWNAFRTVDSAAPYLSKAFVDANFEFRSKTLRGQAEQQPRWKRGVQVVDRGMGEAVGRVYVAKWFPPEAKAKIDALVAELRVSLHERIDHLAWMSPETKAKASAKLDKFTVKVAYPTQWRDYSALKVTADDLTGDVRNAGRVSWERQVKRLNQPVDRLEWGMTPQTVNAYYNPSLNEIVFPAAILQAPYFDPDADAAVNYGAIGGVIGHEMTHGFDDEGRKFDGAGVLADWWTAQDASLFDASAKRLGAQYNAFEPYPGAHVNGELTMGENIADLGGALVALDAYHRSLHGKPAPIIDGLTGDQRFFLAYAQSWRGKGREDQVRQQLVSDPHSPEKYRVNGIVRNMDAWYEAFGVKAGDKLYLAPEDRVRIW